MPERKSIEQIRRLYPEVDPPTEAQWERVREELSAAIAAENASGGRGEPGRRGRSRWLIPAGVALSAAGATLLFVFVGGPRGKVAESSAAEILRQAADAERELTPPLPGPGEYLYVKSESAYLSSTVTLPAGAAEAPGAPPNRIDPREAVVPAIDYSYLQPKIREVWMGPGDSLLKTRFGEPEFLSESDREAWEADGSPGAKGGVSTDPLGKNEPLGLPSDPDELLRQLRATAEGYVGYSIVPGTPTEDLDLAELIDAEVFSLVGESLRERSATPGQRAALLEVASRLDGIELVGETTDSAGRPGIAVAMSDPRSGIRHTFVFDPDTSALLAEQEEIATDDATYGYPVGTVIGHSTYLERTIVDESGERPGR